MMRKLVLSCLSIISSGDSSRSCCLRSLKSATLPARKSSLACIAVRPAEIWRGARARLTAQSGLVRPGGVFLGRRLALVAHVDGRRRALEDVELADDLGELGHDLHRSGTGADDADALALEVDVVVPARGVERLALERLHALDARQLAASSGCRWRARRNARASRHRGRCGRSSGLSPRPTRSSRRWCGTGSARRSRSARPCSGSTRGSRSPRRTSSTGCSPSPRAAVGSCRHSTSQAMPG